MELQRWAVPAGELWTFFQLPEGVRDDIRRLADEGTLHPDAEIATIAVAWALKKRSLLGRGISLLIFGTGIATTVAGPAWLPGPSVLTAFRDNRLAKRLVALAIATGWTPPEQPDVALELRQPIPAGDLIRRELS